MKAEEWFNTIEDPIIRIRAISNLLEHNKHINDIHNSLKDALINTFVWHRTPEGSGYWDNIHRYCKDNKIDMSKTIQPGLKAPADSVMFPIADKYIKSTVKSVKNKKLLLIKT